MYINAKKRPPNVSFSRQVSSVAKSLPGGPLPSTLRRLGTSDGRTLQQQQQRGARFFSTSSSSAVPSEYVNSEREEDEALSSSGKHAMDGSPAASSAAPSATGYTVVKHPPAPGWEFPPVPVGCESTFAIIRLGNTQHKVCRYLTVCYAGGKPLVAGGAAAMLAVCVCNPFRVFVSLWELQGETDTPLAVSNDVCTRSAGSAAQPPRRCRVSGQAHPRT